MLSEESGVGTSRVQHSEQVENEITPTLAPYRDTDEDNGGICIFPYFFLNVILLKCCCCCFIACMCCCLSNSTEFLLLFYCMYVFVFSR